VIGPTRRMDGWWCSVLDGVVPPAPMGGGGGVIPVLDGLLNPPEEGDDEGIPKAEKLLLLLEA